MSMSRKIGRCIYCGRIKQFSREDYLPRAFGTFRGYEKLNDRICNDCNNCFSNLELEFLRTGIVGALRRLYGIEGRKHHEQHDPFWERLGIIPPVEFYESPLGTRLEPSGRKDGSVQRMRQIVIHDPQGQVRQVPISDRAMSDKEILRNLLSTELRKFNFANGPLVEFHGDQKEWQEIAAIIDELRLFHYEGITWTEPTHSDQIADVGVLALVTEKHMRAVAKIVFHYFLKHFPKYRGCEPQFEEIRKFIKTGENISSGGDIDKFVKLTHSPLAMSQRLLEGMPGWRGHILVAGFDYLSFRGWVQFFIIPKVRFIAPTYEVFLGQNPSPIHYKDMSAHRFVYFSSGKQDGCDGYMDETFPVNNIWLPGIC